MDDPALHAQPVQLCRQSGHVVDNEQSAEATAREIAARCARALINKARASGTPPSVRLVTDDVTADLRDEAVVNFDWRHHTADDALTTEAEQRLRSALHSTSRAVKEAYGASEITLAVRHIYRSRSRLAMRSPDPPAARCSCHAANRAGTRHEARQNHHRSPRCHRREEHVNADTAALEISVSRNVESGVDAYAQDRRYLHRVKLIPAAGPDRDARRPADR